MKSLYSMFLSQAYQDCWDDYNRSMKLKNFPRWDYVILTASNDQQAEGFRRQIEERKEYLPAGTRFAAIPDRGGERVGSGSIPHWENCSRRCHTSCRMDAALRFSMNS